MLSYMSSAYLVTVTYIWYIFIKVCDYSYTLCNKGNSNGNMKLFVLTCNLCTFRSRCSCILRTLTAISVDPVSWLKGLSAEKCRRVTSEACMLIRWTSALCRLLSHTLRPAFVSIPQHQQSADTAAATAQSNRTVPFFFRLRAVSHLSNVPPH